MIKIFHNKNLSDKINYINNLEKNRVKDLGIRIIGRNYFNKLSQHANNDYHNYLTDIFYNEPQNIDFKGSLRASPTFLLRETKELLKNTELNLNDQNILNSLKDLILEKTRKQQDLGF